MKSRDLDYIGCYTVTLFSLKSSCSENNWNQRYKMSDTEPSGCNTSLVEVEDETFEISNNYIN